jgi:hypothetical protein
MIFNFKKYVENSQDVFGFEKEARTPAERTDDLPIRRFSVASVMERLGKNNISLGAPKSKYLTEMRWGTEAGSVRVVWTPRLNVKIQKLHHDREGSDVWVMKKYYFVNDRDFAGQEDVVADEIFEQVANVAKEKLESVMESQEFKFDNIIWSLAAKMRQQPNDTIDFQGVTKQNEHEYDLSFYLKGGGQGTMYGPKSQRPAMALLVKMGYSESTGVIKAIAELIQGVDNTSNWTIQPAEFEENFLPSQPKEEIITAITTALKWF